MTRPGTELGQFLRARREMLEPGDFDIAPSARRRTRGLRREEVAVRAGLSTPYLARLEQGRARNPSPRVIEMLGRALGLDAEAFAHLRRIADPAGAADGGPERRAAERVRPGIRALIASWRDQPAFVIDRFGTVQDANDVAVRLYPGFEPGTNILRSVFLDPHAQSFDPDHELVAARIVADIRATSAGATGDAGFAALLDELNDLSPEFARLWARHDAREKTLGVKRFRHPSVGLLALSFECFTINGRPDLALFVLFADPGTAAERKLRRLSDEGKGRS